ncbi:MAG: hypothetical protein IJV40_14785 [Oscillospiraceae bacterium]|nr:hypothetical protein [Oscillospiraceae bacterium]
MATDRMYDLAFRFRNRKLWQQLADTEVYGVLFADGEIGYCSVMGALGEHLALGVYVGQNGYASYCYTLDHAPGTLSQDDEMELIVGQDCIQCSFESKDMLAEDELAEIQEYCKKNEKKLRGKNAFPQFMKYVPGQYPWHFDSKLDEDRICQALEASLWLEKVLKKYTKEEIRLFELRRDGKIPLLVKNGSDWEIRYTALPSPERVWPTPILENEVLVARIQKMKKKGTWESGTFYFPSPVQAEEDEDSEEDEAAIDAAPYFPLMLMNVDRKTGMVLRPVMGNGRDAEELLRELAEGMLADQNAPKSILVGDDRAFALLTDFCERTGIQLRKENHLPKFLEAKTSLMHQFDRDNAWPDDDEDWDDEDDDDLPFDEGEAEELDQFFETLLKMRDEELKTMPRDLVKMIREMAEWGLVPDELVKRIKKLFH